MKMAILTIGPKTRIDSKAFIALFRKGLTAGKLIDNYRIKPEWFTHLNLYDYREHRVNRQRLQV